MSALKADVIVLGAGIVGVSIAWHLARRGLMVVLVDRRGPGEETSYGNAGVIECSTFAPYMFPRKARELLRHALKQSTASNYHFGSLGRTGPWLLRYWMNSSPRRTQEIALANAPLIRASLAEHRIIAEHAGIGGRLRPVGWIKVYETKAGLAEGLAEAQALEAFDVAYDVLTRDELTMREPFLLGPVAGAIHFTDPCSVADPGTLTKDYAHDAGRLGATLLRGDALSLTQEAGRWRVLAQAGPVEAPEAVIALGPWSDEVTRRLGYRIPLSVKRGYHRHFRAEGDAILKRPLVHAEAGFLIMPAAQGIRLTSGAEFATRDAPPTPVQIARIEPLARRMFPLGAAIEQEPWMGSRPCLPDMIPVLGPAPRHKGLWLAFGHAHHGLTKGPASGRLMAELITGERPFVDPAPYSVNRFSP